MDKSFAQQIRCQTCEADTSKQFQRLQKDMTGAVKKLKGGIANFFADAEPLSEVRRTFDELSEYLLKLEEINGPGFIKPEGQIEVAVGRF